MEDRILQLVKQASEAGAYKALQDYGHTSGEISQNEARKIYGTYFTQAAAAGRLRPVRTGNAVNSTKYFRVQDILNLRTADEAKALLIEINSTIKAI